MNRRSILTKTGKGLMEATGKTSNLSRDLRNILKEIVGKVSVSDLSEKFDKMSEQKLLDALGTMERDGYVREFIGKQDEGPKTPAPRGPASQSGTHSDLDFTAFTPSKPNAKENEEARLQAQAQEIARQARATRAREDAANKAKAEATAARMKAESDAKAKAEAMAARIKAESDAKAKAQSGVSRPGANAPLPPILNPTVVPVAPSGAGILGAGADAQARAQAEAMARTQAVDLERARREAEEKARRDAEEKARREAEDRAKREIEERIKREAEEKKLREMAEQRRKEEEERARREAEARAKREAEERAKREAEDRARRELEERTRREVAERLRREEEERRRHEEEERARREAERQARIEMETKARVDAELRAKREGEERAKRELDERRHAHARKSAEERENARREAEAAEALERSLREAEETAQVDAQERADREEAEQREQEERSAIEAEEADRKREEEQAKEDERRARREAKEEARAAAKARKAERSRERAGEEAWRGDEDALRGEGPSLSAREIWQKRKPRSLLKGLGILLVVAAIVGVAVLPFVPLATGPYEKAAQAWLDQPVKIGSVSLTLLPLPQLKFENVVIGRDPQMKAAVIKATPDVMTLLDDRIRVRSLALDNVTVPRAFLAVLLQSKAGGRGLGAQRITAKGLKLDSENLILPPLDLDASLSADGSLKSATFSNSEQRLSIAVEPGGGKATVDISSGSLPIPIGVDPALFSDFTGKGTASATELAIPNAEARAFGGRVFGNLRLRWSSGWSLEGDLSARQMDAVKIAGPLLATGTVLGKARVSMRGLLPERMILNSQLDGNFSVQKGSINNVDMARLLQGSGSGGGTTFFADLTGDFSADPNRLQVRNIKLLAGLLTGAGQLDMDPQRNLSGRMQIELRAQTAQARSTVTVGGTLANPQFRRTN